MYYFYDLVSIVYNEKVLPLHTSFDYKYSYYIITYITIDYITAPS